MKKVSAKDRAKKDREEYFLNKVRSVYPDFPGGEIRVLIGDDERPGFLVINDERIIGLEVVDYIRGQGGAGSPLRHEEMLRARIVSKAREQFEMTHQIPLQIHFHWYGPL